MASLLARLPAVYREVLLLRFKEEMALEEITVIVGAPLSTIKSRLYRGLESMRKEIEGARV
jgi:RNA polymerase sigma-70 factor (ECF subfamily)